MNQHNQPKEDVNGQEVASGATAAQPGLALESSDGPPPGPELNALILALLLVAPQPTTIAELARGAGVPPDHVEQAVAALARDTASGWVIQRHKETLQLATAPRFARHVRRFLGIDRETRLSPAAVETLAIVAYQQPVTRAEVEAVRGVDCAGVIATLHARGLIETVGRLPVPGNPFQYGTTEDFLRHFGLRSLADLPPLGSIEGRDTRTALEAAIAAAEVAPASAADGEPKQAGDEPEPNP